MWLKFGSIMRSSFQLLLFWLFFGIPSSEQLPAGNGVYLSIGSGSNTGSIQIHNGDQIDLSSYPDYTFRVKLANSTIPIPTSPPRTLFQNVEIRFTVRPPENHGIIMVIQNMHLQRPASHATNANTPDCKLDYIKFNEIDGKNRSGGICGTLANNQIGSSIIRGPRTFVTGVNKGVGVHFFTAGYLNEKNKDLESQSDEEDIPHIENEVTLVFTAYSECRNNQRAGRCDLTQNMCISSNLFCDGTSNCIIQSSTVTQSGDEMNCSAITPVPKDDIETNTEPGSIFSIISSSTESIPSTTAPSASSPSRTTVFPWWVIFPPRTPKPSTSERPKPSINYWNPPTTPRTIIILPNYDYDPEPAGPSWARRIPAFQVILIFLVVVFLIFGTCTLLARINTAKPLIFNGSQSQAVARSRRNDRIEVSNNTGTTPQDVIIMNQMADLNFPNPHAQSPPPRYHEVNELPPSYNTLFDKK